MGGGQPHEFLFNSNYLFTGGSRGSGDGNSANQSSSVAVFLYITTTVNLCYNSYCTKKLQFKCKASLNVIYSVKVLLNLKVPQVIPMQGAQTHLFFKSNYNVLVYTSFEIP